MKVRALDELINLFGHLPGVGDRTATRYAFHVLSQPRELATQLAGALAGLHDRIRLCEQCGNYTEESLCSICSDPRRDARTLCIVARVQDVVAIERGGYFRGRYMVLHQLIAPLDGVGPETMPVAALRERIETEAIEEVILATPLSVDGEATALYLAEVLHSPSLKMTRIASGIPQGGELEYTDHVTLEHALNARRRLSL